MAKKSTRTIPTMILHIKGEGKPDVESLCVNEVFTRAVFKEAVEGIKDAINNKQKTAVLFELDKSDFYVEIDKDQWGFALQSCIDRFIEDGEQYEECTEIQVLINKIK